MAVERFAESRCDGVRTASQPANEMEHPEVEVKVQGNFSMLLILRLVTIQRVLEFGRAFSYPISVAGGHFASIH